MLCIHHASRINRRLAPISISRTSISSHVNQCDDHGHVATMCIVHLHKGSLQATALHFDSRPTGNVLELLPAACIAICMVMVIMVHCAL
jgi:hypothetical protein